VKRAAVLGLILPAWVLSVPAGSRPHFGDTLAEGLRGEALPVRTKHVVARNFAFEPSELEVTPGDTVVFENLDFVPHTITEADRAWDSGSVAPDSVWVLVVRTGGVVRYECRFHPGMKGTLVIR